jgi:hypothetical protein
MASSFFIRPPIPAVRETSLAAFRHIDLKRAAALLFLLCGLFTVPHQAFAQADFADLAAQELADSDYQTKLPGPIERQPPPDLPDWLVAVFDFLGKALYYVLIGAGILAVVAIVWFFIAEAKGWSLPFQRKKRSEGDAIPAQAIRVGSGRKAEGSIEDADRLFANGDLLAAMRLLLQLIIGELVTRRLLRITRDHTGRDVVALGEHQLADTSNLQLLVAGIEQHLFAGQTADQTAYQRCRAAYEALLAQLAQEKVGTQNA